MPAPKNTQHRVVAIVGRPNVGKSALFNRLAGRRIAIVHDQPGVTRDRLAAPMKDTKFPIHVIDTGGIGASLEDGFANQVKAEAAIAIESADLILFVVDVLAGRHVIDEAVAQMLRKQQKPVILGMNKSDDPKHDHIYADFARLGFKNVCSFSATHGRGIEELTKMIQQNLEPVEGDSSAPDPEAEDAQTIRLAIVGRPNVGKSSLFNAILGESRAIVSNVAGTTRDAVDSKYERGGQKYLLIDTAGIRKRGRVDTAVETYSVQRAESSIRRADLVALVFDADQGITAQERKIAGTILEENRPCILVANKFDLYKPGPSQAERLEQLEEYARRELFFLDYAPLVAVSATQGTHLNKIFGAIERVRKASQESPGTGVLNRLLSDALERTPPPHIKGKRLKLFYTTLKRDFKPRPLVAPNVVLFVNHRHLLSDTYLRYLDNQIRKHCPYEGLPIKFDIRERQQKAKNESGS
jgi:GTP-binding protein